MCMTAILKPDRSHPQGHQIIVLPLVLAPSSLFLKIPALVLSLLKTQLNCLKYRNNTVECRYPELLPTPHVQPWNLGSLPCREARGLTSPSCEMETGTHSKIHKRPTTLVIVDSHMNKTLYLRRVGTEFGVPTPDSHYHVLRRLQFPGEGDVWLIWLTCCSP